MTSDLTTSLIQRRNILNNNIAIKEIYKQVDYPGVMFEKKYRFTKQQVSDFYEVDVRTIERILESNEIEITENGYEVLTNERLRQFKTQYLNIPTTKYKDEVNKSPSLGIFNFKAFLNIGMLLNDSERARQIRSMTGSWREMNMLK